MIEWKISKIELPQKDGNYLVSAGNDRSTKVASFFDGKFYNTRWNFKSSKKQNEVFFANEKTRSFSYWMEIPEFPAKPSKTFDQLVSAFSSKSLINLLMSNGIDSIEKLLLTTKEQLYSIKSFKNMKFQQLLSVLFYEGIRPPKQWGNIIDLLIINNNGSRRFIDMFEKMLQANSLEFENINDFEERSVRSYKGRKPYPSENTWLQLTLLEDFNECEPNKKAMELKGFIKRKPATWCDGKKTIYCYSIDESSLNDLNNFYISIGMNNYLNDYPFSITTDIDSI